MTPQEAAALRQLAERVRRLPPPSHRRPDAFHEGRDELARELRALAGDTEPSDHQPDRRPIPMGHVPSMVRTTYGSVRVEVRRRRMDAA